jgi:DNA mismatch repair protein PMS2
MLLMLVCFCAVCFYSLPFFSGTTKINIEAEGDGLTSISVKDNGFGISPKNTQLCALGHCTSKLGALSDLSHHTDYGFRGEALHSLCTVGNVTVRTKCEVCFESFFYKYFLHKNDTETREIAYDYNGRHISVKTIEGDKRGTTVIVFVFFPLLPFTYVFFSSFRSKHFMRIFLSGGNISNHKKGNFSRAGFASW